MKDQEQDASAEILLQGLIAECGEIIRLQLRPAIAASTNHHHVYSYTEAAVSLVKIAARAGETVARLRGGGSAETRHRITVERLALPGGGGKG